MLRAHLPVKGLAGQGGAEPELMALLVDHDRRSWRRLDDEKALAVLLDGGIQVACWPVGQARFSAERTVLSYSASSLTSSNNRLSPRL